MDTDSFKNQLNAIFGMAGNQAPPSKPGYIPYDQIVSGAAFLSDDMRKRYADLLRERGMGMMMAYPGEPLNLMGYYNPSNKTIMGPQQDLAQFGYDVRELPPDAINLIGRGIGYPYVAGHELTHYASRGTERENQDFEDLTEKQTRYLTAYNAPTKEAFIDAIKSYSPKLRKKGELSDSDIMLEVNNLKSYYKHHKLPPILINPDSYAQTTKGYGPISRIYRGIFGIEDPEKNLRDM